MPATPSKTVSARVSQEVHSSIQAALRPDESISDFVLAAVVFELGKRRTKMASDISINDLGRLQQSAMGQHHASNLLLRSLDSKVSKIMKELEIPE